MSDRRFLRATDHVAHVSLKGRVEGRRFVRGSWRRLVAPLTDLCATPGGARERQLPMGARFCVIDRAGRFVFGFDQADGYCGWIARAALGPDEAVTHWVAAPSSHLYPGPDIKLRENAALPMGAALAVQGQDGAFARTARGFVPLAHLRPLGERLADPVAVARLYLGAPYLWGGNSRAGIDCSGLVQIARRACGLACPPDSDLQARMPGIAPDEAALAPGDLVFWRGHVAMVAAPDTIIHANAHHMAVVEEPLAPARTRIAAAGGGAVTGVLRPDPG